MLKYDPNPDKDTNLFPNLYRFDTQPIPLIDFTVVRLTGGVHPAITEVVSHKAALIMLRLKP